MVEQRRKISKNYQKNIKTGGISAENRRFLDCIDGTIIKKVKETMKNEQCGNRKSNGN